jgi:hypothetical protein
MFEQCNTRHDKGLIASVAMNESGGTHVHFVNARLSLIGE